MRSGGTLSASRGPEGHPGVRFRLMAKDLVAVYEALLKRAQEVLGLPDAAATRSKLYSLLLRRPIDSRLQDVLDEFGLSASYVRTHLLSIGAWPADVKDAIRTGLPYQDARQIAKLDEPQRSEVLQPFLANASEPGLTASRTARWKSRALQHEGRARALRVDPDGWVPPAEKVLMDPPPLTATTVFTAAEVAIGDEAMPRSALQGLLAAYVPAGGAVVDPMAGSGVAALTAHDLGRWSWSGDQHPRFEFIHRVDAADIDALYRAVGKWVRAIDLVLLHPPTATHDTDRWQAAGPEAYASWLDVLVRNAQAIVRRDGCVAVVVRPWRQPDHVMPMTDVVARALSMGGGDLIGYHLLVESRGLAEWHVVVARYPN
jgi:hypothetical protein